MNIYIYKYISVVYYHVVVDDFADVWVSMIEDCEYTFKCFRFNIAFYRMLHIYIATRT